MAEHTEENTRLLQEILAINERLNDLHDVDAILDHILQEIRQLTRADAGTVYLVEKEALRFSYVHNDTLLKDQVNAEVYSDFSVPIDDASIVGYVAGRGVVLNIDNAYAMPEDSPVHFNPAFDKQTGYHTSSILTVPIKASQGKIVGVLQLINALDSRGTPIPFSLQMQQILPFFADAASVAIERALVTRELVLRMIQMAAMRDPAETGAHVSRVGGYSAAMYHQWALKNTIDPTERKRMKDQIRVAAMLHDVGKVAISDKILKKPARLTKKEFAIMQEHTVHGARLFTHTTSELDLLSAQIALHHHEKFNGTGYPGYRLLPDGTLRQEKCPLQGKEIPLAARICAISDVFDALCSQRSYKSAWSDQQIFDLMEQGRGEHFDPELVDIFFEIFDVIQAIRKKYTDPDTLTA